MATIAISRLDLFPEGTVLGAYPRSNWLTDDPPSGAPVGAATEEATVEGGAATFSELAADTGYLITAEVGGSYRYVSAFTGQGKAVTGARDEPEGALKSLLTVLGLRGLIKDETTAS